MQISGFQLEIVLTRKISNGKIKEEEEKRSGSLEIVGHVLGAQMMDSSRDQSPGATQQSQDFYTRSSQNAQ